MEFRERIIERFDGFYNQDDDGIGNFTSQGQHVQKWGWYFAFYRVAGGVFKDIEGATKANVYEVLTYLEYLHDEQKLLNAARKS